MKKALLALIVVAFSGAALAENLNIPVPDEKLPDFDAVCDIVKRQYSLKIDVTRQQCGRVMMREVWRKYRRIVVLEAAQAAAQAQIDAALATFDADVPVPPGLRARCGDSTVDTHLGEECDDGNRAPNDGCNEDCQIEP